MDEYDRLIINMKSYVMRIAQEDDSLQLLDVYEEAQARYKAKHGSLVNLVTSNFPKYTQKMRERFEYQQQSVQAHQQGEEVPGL